MVFIDLSGFTALSERLARLGRQGAEEVTAVVDATFVDLLDAAYALGGSLLKFGGDALLLLFEGDRHTARACAAAHRMRARLRRRNPILTPAGKAALRMSVGVHTDRFDLFLVGDRHRELLVTGPAVSTVVTMEGAASAGQIVLSPTTARALGRRHRGADVGVGVLLRGQPAAEEAPAPLLDARADIDTFVPERIRSHVLAGGGQPEHRFASVGFVHFDDVDRLIAEKGVQATAVRLDRLVKAVQQAAADHGVCFLATDVDHDGGKIILTAGVPDAGEDDAGRLLRTLRTVVDASPALPVRIGAHAGAVFAGEVGPAHRRTFTVMGDTVNTAARVMAKARPGEVLATPTVIGMAETAFFTEPVEPFSAKGKAKPIVARRVLAVESERRADLQNAPFTGRRMELEKLQAALARAVTGAGQSIDVVGDPGLGKTRLLEELAINAGSVEIIRLRGDRYAATTAYGALRRLLGEVVGLSPDATGARAVERLGRRLAFLVPELEGNTDVLTVVMGLDAPTERLVDVSPADFQRAVNRAITTLLGSAFGRPVLWIVDDAQWLDAGSAALLRHVAANVAHRPWLVVAAMRTDGESIGQERLELTDLSETDAAALVRRLHGRPLLPADVDVLVQRGAGNPLFLAQLVNSFAEGSDLPQSVEQLVASRIDRLPPRLRHALREAAVLGTSFSLQLASSVGMSRADLAALGSFLRIDAGTVNFRQALFRDVAYAGLPYRQRRDAHRRAAESLLATPDPDAALLSFHFAAAGMPEAWTWSLAAGEQARSRFAHGDAVVFYRRAIEAARRSNSISNEERSLVYRHLGDSLRQHGRPADALDAYGKARRLGGPDNGSKARLAFLEGQTQLSLGRAAHASRCNLRALRLLERDHRDNVGGKDLVRVLLAQGSIRFQQGGHSEAVRFLERGLNMADGIRDDAGVAHACNWLQLVLSEVGDERAREFGERAVMLFRSLGTTGSRRMEAQALNNVGIEARRSGRWEDAVRHYDDAAQILGGLGDAVGQAAIANNIGWIRTDQGRLLDAEPYLEEALTVLTAARVFYASIPAGHLGWIAAWRGNRSESRRLLEVSEELLASCSLPSVTAEVSLRRAQTYLLLGDFGEVKQTLSMVGVQKEGSHQAGLRRVGAALRHHEGDVAGARADFEEALAAAERLHDLYEVGYCAAHLAALGGPDAHDHSIRAAQVWERLGVVAPPPLLLNIDLRDDVGNSGRSHPAVAH